MALDHEDQWDGIRQDTDKSDSPYAAGSAEAASVHSASAHSASAHQDPFDIADLIDGMDDIAAMQPAQFVTDTPFVNDDSSAGSDNTGTSSTDSSKEIRFVVFFIGDPSFPGFFLMKTFRRRKAFNKMPQCPEVFCLRAKIHD